MTETTSPAATQAKPLRLSHFMIAGAGWFVPGLGHLILKKWDRGAAFFVSIVALAGVGLAMGAKLYVPPFTGQGAFIAILHSLAFIADLGAGLLYPVSWMAGFGREYLDRASGDYGTVFFLCAGLLNLLTVLDVYDIAAGRKE